MAGVRKLLLPVVRIALISIRRAFAKDLLAAAGATPVGASQKEGHFL